MKTLLTICLLLITSQVFAKEVTVYDCPTQTDARSCNNCKIRLDTFSVKVNVNANKVLMQNKSGNEYLQTMKHEDTWIGESAKDRDKLRTREILKVFDGCNWEYKHTKNIIAAGSYKETLMYDEEKSMANCRLYIHLKERLTPLDTSTYGDIYFCGK